MNRDYTSEEIIGLIEGVCVAIEEHGWLCSDGHWLTEEELENGQMKCLLKPTT